MWKHNFCLLIFVVFLVGCSKSSIATSTSQPTDDVTRQIMLTSIPLPTTISTSSDIPFSQTSLGHQNKEEFNGYTDYKLLVKNSDSTTSEVDLSSGKFHNEQLLSDLIVNQPAVSENGISIAQIVNKDGNKMLEIHNFLTNHDDSIPVSQEAVLLQWLNDEKLAVWGSNSHLECLNLLLIYDLTTAGTTHPKRPIPELQTDECKQIPLLTDDGMKIIYPWKMFDVATDELVDVYRFTRNLSENSPAYAFRETNGDVSLAYLSGNTLYYLLNTPLSETSKVDLAPEQISLPGLGTKEYWWLSPTWISGQMQVGIDLTDTKTDIEQLTTLDQQVPTRFYLVDFAKRRIYDYGFDRAVYKEGSLPQTVRNGLPSPDGKYLAWTIYDSSSSLPIGSKVLELSSGSILSIPDIEVLGWVRG